MHIIGTWSTYSGNPQTELDRFASIDGVENAYHSCPSCNYSSLYLEHLNKYIFVPGASAMAVSHKLL